MKTFILAMLLASSLVAYCDELTPEQNAKNKEINYHCGQLGGVFESAASYRDMGIQPEEALKYTSNYAIPLESRKKAINLVYFDPVFKDARGHALMTAIFNTCVFGPPKPFKPLK